MSGQIDGAILAKSRPDTAIYTGKQTNAGVSADIGFNGAPQSVSVNAGRSKVNADYAAVKEQTGIAMNSSDVVVGKASRFDGAYFTTATPEDNQTVFKEGVTTTDIQNHMNYKGDAINVGLGAGINPETQKVSPPGISGIGYGKDGDSQTSTTYGAVTGMAGKSDVTTATVSSLNEPLQNSFDKDRVSKQINAQVQITQEYGKEIPKAIGDYASNKQLELIHSGNVEEAKKWGEGGVYRVALHTLSSALATGSIEGAVAGGGTAIVIPKVDEYLKQQGYDEDTRKAVLIGLSAGVGGATGEVSGVANNINQTENNYLNHIENAKLAKLQQEKQRLLSRYSTRLSCLIDSDCKSQLDRLDYQIKELENLSEKRDKEFDTAYDNCRNGKGCQQFYYLHVTQRLQWNAEANTLFLKDRKNGNLNNN